MTSGADPTADSAEDLFENAPCGYVTTGVDGTLTRVNRPFAAMVGRPAGELLDGVRFQDLLSTGARIYYDTHYAPLLTMQGAVREIAVELEAAGGGRVPVLISSELQTDVAGDPIGIRTAVFQATDRRRYEKELLRSLDREHQIARRLQQSMLAGTLPADAALDVAVAYLPADAALDVGGDWYDVFAVRPGVIGLVIGDVVGRGLEAAATMGQLRSAVRALASTGLGPGALLEALDRYAVLYSVGQMATVAYAELELATGRLRLACAGHLPPALLEEGAAPRFVWGGRSAPLDAHPLPMPRAETELVLTPGAVVVLFTDGLIERVDRPLQAGLDGLLGVIDERRGATMPALTGEIPPLLTAGRDARDDVCVIGVRWTPA
ncbi:MAG: phosphoserine phosphatase RsbU/P [Baekduia sp.]|nr:phosphoserine phosphatase RsbU/P [Baekduia sp.]